MNTLLIYFEIYLFLFELYDQGNDFIQFQLKAFHFHTIYTGKNINLVDIIFSFWINLILKLLFILSTKKNENKFSKQ